MTFLGIDVGTTNTKVCLIPQGRTLGVPTPDDPAGLVKAVTRLVQEAADGHRIEGIGITGMAETGVPLGADLEPLTGLIGWRDQPGAEQAARLAQEFGPQEFYARTGLRLSAKLPLTTWRWLGETSDVLKRTRLWAGAPDLVLAALTGRYATHLTHAQRYGVLDLRRRTWDDELLGWGGLDHLPEIAEPMTVTAHTVAGPLPAGIPVVLCGHDHLVGAWAVGVREPGQVADSLGTSEAVITPSLELVIDDELRKQGISVGWYADGLRGVAVSGHGTAGGLVDERLAYLQRDYAWLADVLASLEPSDHPIAPYPNGRQAPEPDPTSTYDVRSPAADPEAELRALVDGLALHAHWMAREQTHLLGIDWRATTAFGGPARLDGWMRRKALVGGEREFAVVPGEATAAAGAALMAKQVVTGRPVEPLPATLIRVPEGSAAGWGGSLWDRFHRMVTDRQ